MKGYRTLIFGAVLAALGFLQGFDFTTIVADPKTAGFVTSAVGIVIIILRKITNTDLGKPE